MAGVAAGDENGIDAGQSAENLRPLFEREGDRLRLAVIFIHRGIPDPHIQTVGGGDAGHADHHVELGPRKMRAIRIVVGARREQLDRVTTKDGELADVAFPLRQIPAAVGVGFGAVGELMAA